MGLCGFGVISDFESIEGHCLSKKGKFFESIF